MFSIFKLKGGGDLIIRSVDLRYLLDTPAGCELNWEPIVGKLFDQFIAGTAQENFNRLRQEETDALIAAERIRRQQDIVQRGKQSMRMVKP